MNSYGWVRHHSGGVGLRSERPGITGTMGPSTSWDQWPRPVTHAVVGAQECTQIDQNGPSAPFRGICVHCCAVGLGCGWPWDRNSVHKWEDRASPRRFGAFVYTVGLRCRCGQARGRRSVHRLAKMAPRRRFGAFVYTVGLWAWVVGGLGIAIMYTNGRIGPLGAVLGHLCTLLGREGRASCNASCIGWHEHPNHHGVPAAPPLGGHLSLGRENRLCATGSA